MKKKCIDEIIIALNYRPPGSLLPEPVDELPNEPNFHL